MTQNQIDILAMRGLFWQKFRGDISQAQLEAEVALIMSRQGKLV